MKKTQLGALITVTLANIAGLCLVTFAWFTAKQTVDNGVSNLVAVCPEIIQEVNYYQYHSIDGVVQDEGIYTFEKSKSDSEEMGKYSIIGSDFQLLIEIVFTDYGSTRGVVLSAISTADIYLGETITDDQGNETPKQLLQKDNNSLSSVVCFYGFNENEIVDDGDYYTVDISEKTKKNFVKEENDVSVINNDSIRISSFEPSNRIYIVLDYDIELIEDIYSLNLGNEAISGEIDSGTGDITNSYIRYVPDFSFFVKEVDNA